MGKISAIIITVIIFLLGFFYWGILPKEPSSNKTIVFAVQKGEGNEEFSSNLEKLGIIKNKYVFQIYVLINRKYLKLQAGKYLLSPAMGIPQIINKFVLGDVVKIEITIPEGFTLVQIENEINAKKEKNTEIKLSDKKLGDYKKDYQFLKDAPDNSSLEGYLFPDTYKISYDANADAIIRTMLNNFNKKLTQTLRDEIAKQKKSVFEVITMASLIEKEVKTIEDKKIVSGILWKRLSVNMPLQVDATITYITGKKTTKVSIIETQIDSPYNTYKYKGLPEGPISNPGLESIIAAIYPKESVFWYYLSGIDGLTVFSKTLKQHNTNIRTWLR